MIPSRREGNINKQTKLKSFLTLDRRSVSPHRPACVRALRGQWAIWLAPRLPKQQKVPVPSLHPARCLKLLAMARSSDAPFIRLVPEHAASFRPHSSDRSRRPLFSSDAVRCASHWVFLFDLEDALIFPPEIAATLQRPDIVIFSRALRQVILIELTVPLEDRVCLAHERKRNRYLPLLSLCQSNGWNSTHFPVEVGSRGFVAYIASNAMTRTQTINCFSFR